MVDIVNKIASRKSNNQIISSIIEPETINSYFKEINTSLLNTVLEQLPLIQSNGSCLTRAAGPDQLPHRLWKDYAHQLVPIFTKIYNHSIMLQSVPTLWKIANVRPILKESPIIECTQLRSISLTKIIMRLFERLVFKQQMSTEFKSIIKKRPIWIKGEMQYCFSPLKMSAYLLICFRS